MADKNNIMALDPDLLQKYLEANPDKADLMQQIKNKDQAIMAQGNSTNLDEGINNAKMDEIKSVDSAIMAQGRSTPLDEGIKNTKLMDEIRAKDAEIMNPQYGLPSATDTGVAVPQKTQASLFGAAPAPQVPEAAPKPVELPKLPGVAIPDYTKGLEGAFKDQSIQAQKAIDEQKKLQTEREGMYKSQQDDTDRTNKQLSEAALARENGFQEKLAAFNQKSQELLDRKIDPERFWSNMSVGQKSLGLLSIFMGSLGGSARGGNGQNQALSIINRRIDQDIEAQKNDIEQGRRKLDNEQNMLKFYYEQTKSIPLSQAMLKDNLLEGYKIQAQKMQDKATSVTAQQNLEMFKAKIGEEQIKTKAAMQNLGYEAASKQADAIYKKAAAQKELADAMKLKLAQNGVFSQVKDPANMTPQQIMSLPDDLRKTYVPGIGFMTHMEGAKNVAELKVTNAFINQKVNRLIDISKKVGFSDKMPGSKLNAEAESIQKELVGLLRVPVTGPGALNDGERKMLLDIIPNPTKLFSLQANNQIRLNELKNMIRTRFSQTIDANKAWVGNHPYQDTATTPLPSQTTGGAVYQ